MEVVLADLHLCNDYPSSISRKEAKPGSFGVVLAELI